MTSRKLPSACLEPLAIAAIVALLGVLGIPRALLAQPSSPMASSSSRVATRAELEAAAMELDRLSASTAYGETTRMRARTEAAAVRRRLTEGDFHVGDRLIVNVEGPVVLDDTVTVLEGVRITIRGIRDVALAGVLRSELTAKLRSDIIEISRNTTRVSARPLLRLAVFGSVTNPGYLSLPPETTVDQLINAAGGPSGTADMGRVTLERADTVLLTNDAVRTAIAQGRTVEALGLADGDALVVPDKGQPMNAQAKVQLFMSLVFPILTIFVFRRR